MGVEEPPEDEFRGLNLSSLQLDQAFVNVSQTSELQEEQKYYLYLRSENCYKCPFRPYDELISFEEFKEVNLRIQIYTLTQTIVRMFLYM